MVALNSRDQQRNASLPQKRTWINSSVIASAKKLAIHLSVQLYKWLKMYSRCLKTVRQYQSHAIKHYFTGMQ